MNIKPSFIIIGAQKAGTTSLYEMLIQHSELLGSTTKEVHYFDRDEWYHQQNIDEYHHYFPTVESKVNVLSFEATPMYLFHPEVAERLYQYNAQLKLIVLLRNPVERALSAWTMYHYSMKGDPRTFEQAIAQELRDYDRLSYYNNKICYVKRGVYHEQIERYLKLFPKEQLLFLDSNEFKTMPSVVLEKVTSFLGVRNEEIKLLHSNASKVENKQDYPKQLAKLKEFYEPYNYRLYELLGNDYGWDANTL